MFLKCNIAMPGKETDSNSDGKQGGENIRESMLHEIIVPNCVTECPKGYVVCHQVDMF
jgi:hypothetical protein